MKLHKDLTATVWSQPPLKSDEMVRRVEAREGSAVLLEEMEAAFTGFARRHGIDYLDARTLLMNATGL